jgi:hypothetical protein
MAIPLKALAAGPPDDPYTQALVNMYRTAMLELQERARQVLLRDRRKLTAEAKRARVLMGEVEVILNELDENTAAWIAENIPRHYKGGVKRSTMALNEVGFSASYVAQPILHKEAIEVLVNDIQDDLLATTEHARRGFRRLLKKSQLSSARDKAMSTEIAKGVIEGKARREASKEIGAKLFQDFGTPTIRVGSKTMSIDHYAELVARTRTKEAHTAGSVNRAIEAGQDLLMISAHGAKDGCAYYEGKVFSVSGGSEKYPSINSLPNGGPPFHPNCKHSAMPFVEPLASGTEKRRAKGVPDKVLNKSMGDVEKIYRQEHKH